MLSLYKNKKRIAFFLTLDPQRKKLFAKYFCINLMKRKINLDLDTNYKFQLNNYPELERDELLVYINKLGYSGITEIVEGKHYKEDYQKVFNEEKTNDSQKIPISENSYNPYSLLEKSREIEEIEYKKMNLYNYFEKYNNFIKAFQSTSGMESNIDMADLSKSLLDTKEKEKIETFLNCICKIYIGHSIHQRINNEISKKTNLFILKGDYFISLGYATVTTLGNPLIVRFYSKIAENFAKSMFYPGGSNQNSHSQSHQSYINHLFKKYIGLIYYGCCGINELHQNFIKNSDFNLMKEFSYKFGMLLYLKEELAFLKNKSYEYYAKVDDLINAFLFYSEPMKTKLDLSPNASASAAKNNLLNLIEDKTYSYKYKYFAVNLCADLLEIIDKMTKDFGIDEVVRLKKIEDMRHYLKEICIDVENLTMI